MESTIENHLLTNSPSHAMKMMVDKGYICMYRCDGSKTVQLYDREQDGRIFTCAVCTFRVCTDCNRPEHTRESCHEYKSRLAAIHSEAEIQTHKPSSPARTATPWSYSTKPAATRSVIAGISSAAAVWSTGSVRAAPTLRAKRLTGRVASIA
jgi:hypothetical protein